MLNLNKSFNLKKEFKSLLNIFEDNNLCFVYSKEYIYDKNKLLNKKLINLKLIEGFIQKYATDNYTKIIWGINYKKFHANYKDKFDLDYDIKFNEYLYLKFNQINNETIKKVIDILDSNNKCKYLIIDLRDNLGGNVEECARLLGRFIFKHSFFTLEYKNKTIDYRDMVDNSKYELNKFKNIFVWVSENTISSAEILALSLRHNVSGTYLLGNLTGGKTVGQSITINEKYKFIFSCTTFKWRVGENSSYSLEYYLKKDSNNIFAHINDFYKATIELSTDRGVEKD